MGFQKATETRTRKRGKVRRLAKLTSYGFNCKLELQRGLSVKFRQQAMYFLGIISLKNFVYNWVEIAQIRF